MFKNNLTNVDLKYGSRTILQEALAVFVRLFGSVRAKRIRDIHGIIAFRIGNLYLTAKKEPYGDLVSVHRKIWDEAKAKGRKIIIYIQLTGYFYRFDPEKIKETSLNIRGDYEMVNFDIKEGTNIMRLAAFKRRLERVAEKNRQYLARTEEEKMMEFSRDYL